MIWFAVGTACGRSQAGEKSANKPRLRGPYSRDALSALSDASAPCSDAAKRCQRENLLDVGR